VPVTRSVPSAPQVALPGARPAGSLRSLALRAIAVCALSAGLAVGVATLAQGSSGSATPPPPPPVSASAFTDSAAEVTAVPAQEAAAFAILRRPRTAADSFAQIRRGSGPFGANPALARSARVPASRNALAPRLVSVVPASGGVCLRILASGGYAQWWCMPMAQARLGSLTVAQLPPSPTPRAAANQYLVGLVPDGVATVEIRSADGSGHKVVVRSNVYATAALRPVSIAFELPGRGLVTHKIRD
jgi:hypothetical protein